MQKRLTKILSIFILLPFVVFLLFSIFVNYQYDNILPTLVSFKNYKYLITSEYMYILLFSIIMSFVVAVVATVISYLFVRTIRIYDVKLSKIFKLLTLMPILIPSYAYIIGLGMAFNIFGLNDSLIGVCISHIIVILPYAIFILDNSMSVVGADFEEVAKTFGASERELILGISIPMLKKSILNAVSIGFVISFSQYFLTAVIGGGVVKTYAMYIFPLIQSNNRSLASATSLIFLLINAFVYMFMIKNDNVNVNSL